MYVCEMYVMSPLYIIWQRLMLDSAYYDRNNNSSSKFLSDHVVDSDDWNVIRFNLKGSSSVIVTAYCNSYCN